MSFGLETELPQEIRDLINAEEEKTDTVAEIERPEFPESILYANLKGNGLWPQSDLGVGMYTLSAVLENELSLETFFQSDVNELQVNRMVTAMSGYHAKANVNYNQDNFDYARIKQLANVSKPILARAAYVGNQILFGQDTSGDLENFMDDYFNIEGYQYILDFFEKPEIEPIKRALSAGVAYLNSAEGKDLSKHYIESLHELQKYKAEHSFDNEEEIAQSEAITDVTIGIITKARENLKQVSIAALDPQDLKYESYKEFVNQFVENIGFTKSEAERRYFESFGIGKN